MKIAFWFVGSTCAGKSKYSVSVVDKLGASRKNLDLVFDIQDIYDTDKRLAYGRMFGNMDDLIVIDGIVPFNREEDMSIVMDIIKDYKIIYVLIAPDYDKWLKNVDSRKMESPEFIVKTMTESEYDEYNQKFRDRLERFIEIKKEEDLEIISEEQIRNLRYQHAGFTDIKWAQLKIDPKGKTILDLGCSSCQYESFFIDAGATKYHGLDINFSYLINENAELFNLNELEKWNDTYDIVVCTSVFHYIKEKEKFIKECSRITKELCVLEIPLDKGTGKELCLGSRNLYFPTRGLFEEWLGKYFSSFECIGESIVEDGSYRLIYHCFPNLK